MTAYLIRRVSTTLVILIGISIFIFMLLRAVFPSPAIVVLGPKASPQAVRSSAIETLAQDYIKTARAKGLPERPVLLRHLLRNACLPMITLIGLSIPGLAGGEPRRRVRVQLQRPRPVVL